jgi:hypothetical protein
MSNPKVVYAGDKIGVIHPHGKRKPFLESTGQTFKRGDVPYLEMQCPVCKIKYGLHFWSRRDAEMFSLNDVEVIASGKTV